jgi:hypothetical protein
VPSKTMRSAVSIRAARVVAVSTLVLERQPDDAGRDDLDEGHPADVPARPYPRRTAGRSGSTARPTGRYAPSTRCGARCTSARSSASRANRLSWVVPPGLQAEGAARNRRSARIIALASRRTNSSLQEMMSRPSVEHLCWGPSPGPRLDGITLVGRHPVTLSTPEDNSLGER